MTNREIVVGPIDPADEEKRPDAITLGRVLLADLCTQGVIVEAGCRHEADDEGGAALFGPVGLGTVDHVDIME